MNQAPLIIQVALTSPFRHLFDYKTHKIIQPGTRVSVPFGKQKVIMGIAINHIQQSTTPNNKLRAIHQTLDEQPIFSKELLELCQWCASYYHYPLGEVCQLAIPTALRKPEAAPKATITAWKITEKGLATNAELLKRATKQRTALTTFQTVKYISAEQAKEHKISPNLLKALAEKALISKQEVDTVTTDPSPTQTLLKTPPLILNSEQQQALDALEFETFNTYLLYGLTGSGKTEVYLQAIEKVLRQNQQVLVLVPEIGLTPQTVSRFEQRFNVPITTLHSNLTEKQRFTRWQSTRTQRPQVVIGTRSSIFSPLPNLGLIVVDEEHDLSYKQQEGVRYSARDLAIVRAQKRGIPLILGSATPSLESFHNALTNRYQLLTLTQRTNNQIPPTPKCIETIDQQLNDKTIEAIRQTLDKNLQVLIFINRRGYAPTLICQSCGWISQCPKCDSRMTLHRSGKPKLHCHHCDTQSTIPLQCPHCHSHKLEALGSGTQRTEEQLEQLFNDTPVLRIDRDSVARKGQFESMLNTINSGETCILVGTQILAKGHHFSHLGLVVILGLDSAFFSSDFRGAERMGQLLTQVAGRTGREKHPGKVLIQTQFADHPLLQQLITEGYNAFARTVLAERQASTMPPYEYLATIRCHAQQPQFAQQFLMQARHKAEQITPPHAGLQYLGPFSASMEKRNNRYHFLLQIKCRDRGERQHLLRQLCTELENTRAPTGLHWLVDVDPLEF